MPRCLIYTGLILMALLQGCARTPQFADYSAMSQGPYTLASGDRLRVIVFGQDSLSNSYSVDGAGNIAMPLIGLIPAQGRTTQELSHELETHLRNGFLRQPRVSVEVEAYRPFFVLGEVTTAGQYPYVNGMTVQTAVAIAGGYSPRASKSSAELTRVVEGAPATYSVPPTFPVRPGDTITIKERFF